VKRLLFGVLVGVVTVAPAFGHDWFKGTLSEAQAAARAQGKLVLIDFGGPG